MIDQPITTNKNNVITNPAFIGSFVNPPGYFKTPTVKRIKNNSNDMLPNVENLVKLLNKLVLSVGDFVSLYVIRTITYNKLN
jgi:hypothetical protein